MCGRAREARPRRVVANDAAGNAAHGWPSNAVSNTKFTPLTFLPLSLLGQFQRPMNVYFLLIACLQLIPAITPVNPLTTWLPLAGAPPGLRRCDAAALRPSAAASRRRRGARQPSAARRRPLPLHPPAAPAAPRRASPRLAPQSSSR